MNSPLKNRTLTFSRAIIELCSIITKGKVNNAITSQLVRSGTSIGANYREALGAVSRSDFRNKIHICKKEADETNYWLKLLYDNNKFYKSKILPLINESHELTLIFAKIVSTMKKPRDKFNM